MPRWFVTSVVLVGAALAVAAVLALGNGEPSSNAAAVGASPTETVSATPTVTPTMTPTPASAEEEPPEAEALLLRLGDVPPGYMIGGQSGCRQITGEGGDARLERFLSEEFVEFCLRQMNYVCPDRTADFPLQIASVVVYLASEEQATRAMGILPSLVGAVSMGPELTPRGEHVEVGDGSRAFEVSGLAQTPGTLIAWRNGTTLNLIQVIDPAEEQAVFMLEALAQVQNERFTNPLEPAESDTYDIEVRLGCGESEAPVYWLGDVFEGEDGDLPEVELTRTRGSSGEGDGPGDSYHLEYSTSSGAEGFAISVWTMEQWEAFLASEIGSGATSRPCGEPETIELSDRTIELHSPMMGCSQRFMAHVLFPDAIVTVNVPMGLCCTAAPGAGPGEFDTPAALEAIARALVRR